MKTVRIRSKLAFLEFKIFFADDDINQSLRNLEGDALPGFPSPDTFEMLISPHLAKLLQPSLDCLQTCQQILSGLANKMSVLVFYRFPELGEQVFEVASKIIEEEETKTKGIIEDVVNSTTGYFFTNDDAYLISHGAMQPTAQAGQSAVGDIAEQKAAQHEEEKDESVGGYYKYKDALSDRMQNAKDYIRGVEKGKHFESKYSQNFLRDIRNRLEAYFKLV